MGGGEAARTVVGFVNVVSDGLVHAWIQDLMVAADERGNGIGTKLVVAARDGAKDAGCEWLHVDFDDDLRPSTSQRADSPRPTPG